MKQPATEVKVCKVPEPEAGVQPTLLPPSSSFLCAVVSTTSGSVMTEKEGVFAVCDTASSWCSNFQEEIDTSP